MIQPWANFCSCLGKTLQMPRLPQKTLHRYLQNNIFSYRTKFIIWNKFLVTCSLQGCGAGSSCFSQRGSGSTALVATVLVSKMFTICVAGPGLSIHCMQVHKETMDKVRHTLSFHLSVFSKFMKKRRKKIELELWSATLNIIITNGGIQIRFCIKCPLFERCTLQSYLLLVVETPAPPLEAL